MPIGEIAGELLGGVIRFFGGFLVDVVFEILVKGLGYLICRPFSKNVNPDGFLVIILGLVAWVVLFFALYSGYSFLSNQLEIDRCLDGGGSYNHETSVCAINA